VSLQNRFTTSLEAEVYCHLQDALGIDGIQEKLQALQETVAGARPAASNSSCIMESGDLLSSSSPFAALYASSHRIQQALPCTCERQIHHNLETQDIILRRVLIWKWLELETMTAWNTPDADDHWLGRLTKDVREGFTTKKQQSSSTNFRLGDYFSSTNFPESADDVSVEFPAKRPSEADLCT
jgi:hypothetical protein